MISNCRCACETQMHLPATKSKKGKNLKVLYFDAPPPIQHIDI